MGSFVVAARLCVGLPLMAPPRCFGLALVAARFSNIFGGLCRAVFALFSRGMGSALNPILKELSGRSKLYALYSLGIMLLIAISGQVLTNDPLILVGKNARNGLARAGRESGPRKK